MKLSQLLEPAGVLLNVDAPDKWAALAQIVDHLSSSGLLPEDHKDDVLSRLEERERSMSTGMEFGIAVPHTASDDVTSEVVCLALSPKGIPFESINGENVHIMVCLVTPRARKLLHIRTLAEVARLLSHESVRSELLAATTVDEVIQAIQGGEQRGIDVA